MFIYTRVEEIQTPLYNLLRWHGGHSYRRSQRREGGHEPRLRSSGKRGSASRTVGGESEVSSAESSGLLEVLTHWAMERHCWDVADAGYLSLN